MSRVVDAKMLITMGAFGVQPILGSNDLAAAAGPTCGLHGEGAEETDPK